MPFTFANPADYDDIDTDDILLLDGIREKIENGGKVILRNITKGNEYELAYDYSERQRDMILAGGLLNYTKNKAQ